MSKELCKVDRLSLHLFYEKSIRRLRVSPTKAESEIKENLTALLDEFCGATVTGFDMEEWGECQMGINTTDKAKIALEMYSVLEEMIIAKHEKDNRVLQLHKREEYHQRDKRFLEIVKEWADNIKPMTKQAQSEDCTREKAQKSSGGVGGAKRGRQQKTLINRITSADKESVLQVLHSLIDGRLGKEVALVILASVKSGIMTKPTYTEVYNEFGDIGHRSGYNKYMDGGNRFTEDEINGMIANITSLVR